ncbi:hypothetical protein [Thermus oshimai]|uniref:hypothetical protein n=1 Tax=Thermus oshimai TaxID=56957 RepID=UPI0012DC37BC|nr:hypothetical protein [Thermus oshimai]
MKKLLSEIEERYRRTEDALEVADWVRESIRAYSEGQIARRKRPYRNYGLFSEHFLVNRLPESEEWREDPEPVRAKLQRLYREKEALLKDANEAQTEEEFIRPVLEVLGFAYWVQDTTKATGGPQRPDYVLYPDEDTKRKAVGHKTDEVKRYAPALAIAEAKYWGRDMT